MISTSFFTTLRKRWQSYESARRQVIAQSAEVLTASKQAIFAFHRGDVKGAEQLLVSADRQLAILAKGFKKTTGLSDEGSYRAALEEYAEARIFHAFVTNRPIGPVTAPAIDEDAIVGGLLDFTGEAVRYAIRAATEGRLNDVARACRAVDEIAGQMIQMNLTGSARQKYDQMKINVRKLEEIQYDLSLRGSRP